MKDFSIVIRQTFWQVAGKIVTAFSTLIVLGIIARNYHEAGTGIFTLSLAYLNIFNLLADFGFNAHVLKKVQSSEFRVQSQEWKKLLGSRILWSTILVILSIFLLPTPLFANKEFSLAVLLGSLAIIGFSIFITCNLIFQSKQRYDLSVLASSIGSIISLAIYIWLSRLILHTPLLLVAYQIGWFLTALISLLLVKKFLPNLRPIFDIAYIKTLFKDSWPIAATLSLNVIYFRADAFIISYYHGVVDAGIYNVAYALFQTVLVLPTFMMNAYYPLMLKSLLKVKWMGVWLVSLAILATLSTQFLAPFLINILTGGGFDGTTQSLRILSLSFPAFFLSALLMWWLITKNKYRMMLVIYAVGLLVNLLLNFIYIPEFSYIAASWITVICEYLILMLLTASVV